MSSNHEPSTSASLLGRLRRHPPEPAAWKEFVERYGRPIYGWCRRWGLQRADAEDVTQDVFLRLARALRTFEYDPAKRFRAWLRTVARNALRDFCNARRHDLGGGCAAVLELFDTLPARTDLLQRLEEVFDRELLDEALARVRGRVKLRTWQVFYHAKIQGWCGARVAKEVGIPVLDVFVYANRVLKLVQKELKRLERQPRSADPTRRNGYEPLSRP